MSSRRIRSVAFLLATTTALVAAGSFAVTACSSTAGEPGSPDSGTEAAPPKPRPDSGGGDPDSGKKTPQQCYDDCLNATPSAKSAYVAVDSCWANKCKEPCLQQSGKFDGGAPGDAGADAGARPDSGGLCGTSVGSGLPDNVEKACNDCTETFCCAEWFACYTSGLCNPIDQCLAECE